MRILVAGAFEAGSQFAHAINTVKMAQGFARLACEVTVVCRRGERGELSPETLADVYGLRTQIQWRQLPRGAGDKRKFAALALLAAHAIKPDLIYARNYVVPLWSSRWGLRTVAETHAHTDNRSRHFLRMLRQTSRRRFLRLVTISDHLADYYQLLGVPREKLLVLPDAVDLQLFARPSRLPESPYSDAGPHVVYAGHLYEYKGIPTVLAAAQRLPSMRFHLVGGTLEDRRREEARAAALGLSNVRFHGLVPHAAVPRYLWHADVLLLPPSRHHPSARWTSPVKLGEYLAARVPVAASDIPALRAWLDDSQVEFFHADDAGDLARAIERLAGDILRAKSVSNAGWDLAQRLSYRQRALSILQHCGLRSVATRAAA